MTNTNKLLIICGPTATGKTALAAYLAKQFDGELISADSRQVYRGMDIATGKDRPVGIPVWLYDVVDPDEEFSVSHFHTRATAAIADIHARGKLPIVVGGTGLYIQSLVVPIETASIPPNKTLREELGHLSLDALQQRLQKEDRVTWEKMNGSDRKNPRRLIRKLEIARSGQEKSYPSHMSYPSYDVLSIGLTAPNDVLYKRIDARVDARVAMGVEGEIQTLLSHGCSWELPSMNTLGYKEFKDGFTEAAVQQWKYDEHAYARRQLTWFKKMSDIFWISIEAKGYMSSVADAVRAWYT